MSKVKTHYDNLKVSRNAPQEVIRAAYKVLSQKHHPDRNQGDPNASHIMKIINHAYETLSDPIKRREHDLWIEKQENDSALEINKHHEQQPTQGMQEDLKKKFGDEWVKENQEWINRYQDRKNNKNQNSPPSKLDKFFEKIRAFISFCWGVIVWAVVFGIAGIFIYFQFFSNEKTGYSDNSIASEIPFIEEAETPQTLPHTGYTNKTGLIGVAPLQIKVSYGDNYWVKIVDSFNETEVASYFIRSGEVLNVDLPLGSYKIRYAYGQNWFGEKKLFGKNTAYAQADEIMHFGFDGYSYNGYTIELISQVNGNLHTSGISQEQF